MWCQSIFFWKIFGKQRIWVYNNPKTLIILFFISVTWHWHDLERRLSFTSWQWKYVSVIVHMKGTFFWYLNLNFFHVVYYLPAFEILALSCFGHIIWYFYSPIIWLLVVGYWLLSVFFHLKQVCWLRLK